MTFIYLFKFIGNFRIFRALVQQHIDAQYSSNGNSSTLRSPGKVNKPAPLPPPAKISE